MAIAAHSNSPDLTREMRSSIGRHTDKSFDWDAFPGSQGFPELARAQMRYIGAGGSPKTDDPNTLKPGAFTLSLIHQPVGKYAACHSHEVVEHFLVLDGVLTVGWAWGDEVIEARLGPLDMVLNQQGRPHGFRNDGVGPVLMSISVGSGMPKPPVYACHPRDGDPALDAERRPVFEAGLARLDYIGEAGAPPGGYRMEMIHLPPGVGVRGYGRAVEDSYLVLDGALTVGWEAGGETVEQRLGRMDVILNPPGRTRYFRNDGVADAVFMLVCGNAPGEDLRFEPS